MGSAAASWRRGIDEAEAAGLVIDGGFWWYGAQFKKTEEDFEKMVEGAGQVVTPPGV